MTGGEAGAYVIDGRFELIARLGGGGMGLVWRARDLMLQREVALKEVRSPDPAVYGADPSEAHVVRERVLREAQALARLHHPNVVTIHHIVDTPELAHPWLVMELVTGGSLEGRLKRGTLTVPEAASIGRGVLAALRAAHAAGIQHRDVKPGNVLLRPDGTPVLTDFGIAALEATPGLTATGMLIGSPEYMAPERIHGREGDPASDLWSLGIMLYLGLEGHNPLRRDSTIATIAAVAEANVPPPVRSGALTPVLTALLVKDPARRPTAEQLDWMLAEAQESRSPAPAYPAPPPFESATGEGARPEEPTGRTRNPASPTNPIANPYGTGTTPVKKRAYVVPYALSTVFAIGMAGTIMYMSHTFGGGPAANTTQGSTNQGSSNQGLSNQGTDNADPATISISGTDGSPSGGSTGGGPTAAGDHTDAPALGKNLLTPAAARTVIASAAKAAGSSKFVEITIFDDGHAVFDIVKKDDPGAYDSWMYRNGKTAFWTPGSALGDKKTFQADKINWDALPAIIKDGRSTLNVKNPTTSYVIANADSDDTPNNLQLDFYLSSDYYSGYLHCDATGKIVERYPQK
jgi:serine/threonine protein kinase